MNRDMHLNIYRPYENRRVVLPADHEAEVLASIRALSIDCRENVLMLELELRRHDPEPGTRCGVLKGDVEVFAVPIPSCREARLAISVCYGEGTPPPALIHGAVAARGSCRQAQRVVMRHRRLEGAAWEPAE